MHKSCLLNATAPFTTLINGRLVLPVVVIWTVLQPVVVSILKKKHQFGGSKRGVLYKECKQVCWCHIKPDPACQVCTIVLKNGQCSSDSMDVKTAPCPRDKIHTSDIRKLLKPNVTSNTTRLVTNSNELALSNRCKALATNSDVESDTQISLSVPSDSVHSLHLQRSVCSDDRNFTIKEPNIDATLVVPKNSKARKSDTVNTCLKIHEKVTSDNDIRPVNPVHLLGNLDAMDPVTQVTQMDTVDFAPIWCTDCKILCLNLLKLKQYTSV